MPSSMIFASLVVLWLLILVPAVARHRQEVARPSVAALSGRVLARSPRRRSLEVNVMDGDDGRVVATRTVEVQVPSPRVDEAEHIADGDERAWERPVARYRAGRGGFDAEAAAMAARARYAFRQRVVLTVLVAAIATGVVAAVALPVVWWAHGAIDAVLVGYLIYLRRQVRMEEAIRARRAARMAGTRRPAAADDPELDDWAARGRAVTRPEVDSDAVDDESVGPSEVSVTVPAQPTVPEAEDADVAPEEDAPAEVVEEERPALPRLRPTPPPPLPAGTTLVEDEEDELDLDDGAAPGYRRAAGE